MIERVPERGRTLWFLHICIVEPEPPSPDVSFPRRRESSSCVGPRLREDDTKAAMRRRRLGMRSRVRGTAFGPERNAS